MIIYTGQIDCETKVQPQLKDLAIASYMVNCSVQQLRTFLESCCILSKDEMQNLLAEHTVKKTFQQQALILDNDEILYYTGGIGWAAYNQMYYLKSALAPNNEGLTRIKEMNESHYLSLQLIDDEIRTFNDRLLKLYSSNFHRYSFFDKSTFFKECKQRKIKFSIVEDYIVLHFDNVKVDGGTNGYIQYNNITLFIKDFQLDTFVLRFNKFDFSSRWGLNIRLHPYLVSAWLPFGRNNFLQYASYGYESYIQALYDMVYAKDLPIGYDIMDCISTYNDMLKIWETLRINNGDRSTDRTELSKKLLEYYLK